MLRGTLRPMLHVRHFGGEDHRIDKAGSDLLTKALIRTQVEFYLSDSNVPVDDLLWEKISADPQGYVPIKFLVDYPRLRGILGLTEPVQSQIEETVLAKKVADALSMSAVLEVSSNKRCVRRRHPLGNREEMTTTINDRSVQCGPLPLDSSLNELLRFFNKLANVRSIRKLKDPNTGFFYGEVFVEFESKQLAHRVAQMEGLEYARRPLQLELKPVFMLRGDFAGWFESPKEKDKLMVDLAPSDVEGGEMTGDPHPSTCAIGPASSAGIKRKRSEIEADEQYGDPDHVPDIMIAAGRALRLTLPDELVQLKGIQQFQIRRAIGEKVAGIDNVSINKGYKQGFIKMRTPEAARDLLEKAGEERMVEVAIKEKRYKVALELLKGDQERKFYILDQAERSRQRKRRAFLCATRGLHTHLDPQAAGASPFAPGPSNWDRGLPFPFGGCLPFPSAFGGRRPCPSAVGGFGFEMLQGWLQDSAGFVWPVTFSPEHEGNRAHTGRRY